MRDTSPSSFLSNATKHARSLSWTLVMITAQSFPQMCMEMEGIFSFRHLRRSHLVTILSSGTSHRTSIPSIPRIQLKGQTWSQSPKSTLLALPLVVLLTAYRAKMDTMLKDLVSVPPAHLAREAQPITLSAFFALTILLAEEQIPATHAATTQ
jgi:hypothetical protein